MQSKVSQSVSIFILVWFGQLVSLSGTRLTSFALGVWVYQRTGSATQFALIAVFAVLPYVLLSPLAGALVDRWDRRRIMILSDTGAGVTTLVMVILLSFGALELWQIYLVAALNSALNAFQEPAYAATVPLLVPKQHLGRANGMLQAGRASAKLVAPALAGVLVTTIGLQGVMLVDGATFIFALVSLLIVRFPEHQGVMSHEKESVSLYREVVDGWSYLAARPTLLLLLGFFALTNFLVNVVAILVTPAILSMADARVLGTVMSAGGTGMLLGSLLMSAWGGPKRQIYAVLGFVSTLGLGLVIAGLRPSPSFFAAGAFLAYFSLPLFQGSGQAILQSKIAPGVQGRVFSLRGMVVSLSMLVAFLGAGPLADHVFEPLLVAEGRLADSVGAIVGLGPGRGIGLMFILMGLLTILTAVGGLLVPRLRNVDADLPDFDLDKPLAMKQKPRNPAPLRKPAEGQNVFIRQPVTLSELPSVTFMEASMAKGFLIGRGRIADVYSWGEGQAIKLFRNGTILSQVEQEASIGRALYQAGLPVPATGQIIKSDGHYGIVFEQITGRTMLTEMSTKPWKLIQYARLMAELHVAMHDVVVPGLPSQREQLQQLIQDSDATSSDQKEAALFRLDRLPDDNRLTHGDFHPDNIVMTPDGPVMIDWATATRGSPVADVARTSLILGLGDLPLGTPTGVRLLIRAGRRFFNKLYLRRYFQLRPDAQQEFAAWQLPIIAARLGDGIEQEQEKLLELINDPKQGQA